MSFKNACTALYYAFWQYRKANLINIAYFVITAMIAVKQNLHFDGYLMYFSDYGFLHDMGFFTIVFSVTLAPLTLFYIMKFSLQNMKLIREHNFENNI